MESSRIQPMRRTPHIALLTSCVLLSFVLSSCTAPTPEPTATSLPPTDTPVPATDTPAPTSTATDVPAPARAQYTLSAVLDYANKAVTVDETIVYPNHSGDGLTDMVLAVEPDLWTGCFNLTSLSLDGTPLANSSLQGQMLWFQLPDVLQPEATTTIKIQYTLNLPLIEPTNPNLTRPRIFGYSQHQINLTNWYPFVVPRIGGKWILHDPWYYGEHLVYDAADYTVNLRPADPAVNPVIAASGAASANGEWRTYTLTAGRAFVISASTEFLTASTQVGDVTITSYWLQQLYHDSGEAALNATADALQIFEQKYGPYPHKTLAVVMGDFNDGMEFSAFFFLSHDFYNLYDGTQKSYLIFVAAHETAHQWWWEQVANDQALQPWLDEALATYSEHIFYETANPQLVSFWWIYRIDFYNPQGWVDIPVYAGGGFRPYTNAVYFRGAHFLDELRTRIGDAAFFTFLQDYLKQENGKIATASDFFRILAAHTTTDYTDIVRKYFQNIY
jgi:hypothetical protein